MDSSAKFIVTADLHGVMPPNGTKTKGCVAWLLAGDVATDCSAESFLRWAHKQRIPVYYVRGNHDARIPKELSSDVVDLSGNAVNLAAGISIVGVGWCGESCFDLPTEDDLLPICERALACFRKLDGENISVVLLHYPPEHDCVCKLIAEVQPVAVIHGHLHAEAPRQKISSIAGHRTLLVNPGTGPCMLEIDIASGTVTFTPWLMP